MSARYPVSCPAARRFPVSCRRRIQGQWECSAARTDRIESRSAERSPESALAADSNGLSVRTEVSLEIELQPELNVAWNSL